MRHISIILISLFIVPVSYGEETGVEFQVIHSDGYQFRIFESEGSMYSEDCLNRSCQAKAFHIPDEVVQESKNILQLTNPGDKICKSIGGKPFIGRFKNLDEQSFCLFKDKSFVDCGTLYARTLRIERSVNSTVNKKKSVKTKSKKK